MGISDLINVLAIIAAPIVSVVIGQWLQDRARKRQDKMQIFTILMTDREFGWTYQSVHALNIIDVVFSDDNAVREQWKKLYEKLCVDELKPNDKKTIEKEKIKLLEIMAKSLGYKNKITWETIQNPYTPKGMIETMIQQQENQANQSAALKLFLDEYQKQSGGNKNG